MKTIFPYYENILYKLVLINHEILNFYIIKFTCNLKKGKQKCTSHEESTVYAEAILSIDQYVIYDSYPAGK